jgi:selenocysteine-specific elongation factor
MKRLEILRPRVRRPDHRPSLSGEETKAKLRLRDILATRRLEPPTVPELARELQVDRDVLHDLLLLLREEGAIVPLNAELYVTSDTAGELIGRVRAMLADGRTGTPTIFKEEFGVSRKFLIPMLEYLDREGITRRTGEGRVLADMPEAGQST